MHPPSQHARTFKILPERCQLTCREKWKRTHFFASWFRTPSQLVTLTRSNSSRLKLTSLPCAPPPSRDQPWTMARGRRDARR